MAPTPQPTSDLQARSAAHRDELLARYEALGPTISAAAERTSAQRRIDAKLVETLREAGLYRIGLPEDVGGTAVDFPTILEIYETIARFDGSVGWVSMIGSGTNTLMAWLPQDTVREMYVDPDISTGGLLAPRGKAVRVDGGYRVTGRWPFGSGSETTSWLLSGAVVHDEDGPVVDGEARETRVVVFPTDQVTIHDTWHVTGLRGTGSHDYSVEDLFVPDAHTFHLAHDRPDFDFAHARLPVGGFLCTCLAAVLLGMARGLLGAFEAHATTTKLGPGHVKDTSLAKTTLAKAEGLVRSARAFLYDATTKAWDRAVAGHDADTEDDVAMRLASSHAARACSDAADLVYAAGGTAALFEGSDLQRFYRDLKVGVQHGAIAYYTFERIGGELFDANAAT